jgi:hypothetical protein
MVMAEYEIEREAARKRKQSDQQWADAEAGTGRLDRRHGNRLGRRSCGSRSLIDCRKNAAGPGRLCDSRGSGGAADGGG